jgi:hypothetical protein
MSTSQWNTIPIFHQMHQASWPDVNYVKSTVPQLCQTLHHGGLQCITTLAMHHSCLPCFGASQLLRIVSKSMKGNFWTLDRNEMFEFLVKYLSAKIFLKFLAQSDKFFPTSIFYVLSSKNPISSRWLRMSHHLG